MTKRIWTFLLPLALLAGSALAAQEEFSKTYPLSERGRVSLANVNGDMRVQVWDRDEVRVEATKRAGSESALQELRIEVRATPDRVAIETRYPQQRGSWSRGDAASVEYTLTVPRGAALEDVSLVNGDLDVADFEGRLEVDLVNGDVRARGLAGSASVESVNGTVELSFARLGAEDRVSAQSVNGRIEILLPASLGADLSASTVSGRLSNEFDVPVNKHRWVGAEMEGAIAGGGADLSLETVNGSIAVRRQ